MATYGFGPAVERWGGFLADVVCVPYAEHMLVAVPAGVAPATSVRAARVRPARVRVRVRPARVRVRARRVAFAYYIDRSTERCSYAAADLHRS